MIGGLGEAVGVTHPTDGAVRHLTDEQVAAIGADAPALQIVACAGSGKTEVLARRAVRYLADGVPPSGIVAFTFTEKAAAELKERINARAAELSTAFRETPPSTLGMFIGTIHGWCLHVLQEHVGPYHIYDPVTEERLWALTYRFARRLGIVDLMASTWPGRQVSTRSAVEIFLANAALVYNEGIERARLVEQAPAFSAVLDRHERLLSSMRLLPFDHMVWQACAKLRPGGRLTAALAGRVAEVLVDEYQDLNRSQELLLSRLAALGARLTVVGDDDQAIYQWRGGDVSLLLGFPDRYPRSRRLTLTCNHRSAPSIIRVASGFASTILDRVEKSMKAGRTEAHPSVEMLMAETPQQEAVAIVSRIRQLVDAGHQPGDMAVLFRSVRTSAKPLLDALAAAKIPYAVVGRVSLLDRPETALVARVFAMWAGGTWRPDGQEEVVTAERLAEDLDALASVGLPKAQRAVSDACDLGRRVASGPVPEFAETYMTLLRVLGLPADGPNRSRQEQGLGRLSRLLVDFEHAQKRYAPPEWAMATQQSALREAEEDGAIARGAELAWAARHGAPAEPGAGQLFLVRLRGFLEQFASAAVEETPEGPQVDQEAVNIMTIHQAKGLEFPVVFVPSLVDRRFPASQTGKPGDWYIPTDMFDKARYEGRIDDERRLFYVAMTRARELLVLSWFARTSKGAAIASPFVSDLVGMAACRSELQKPGHCRPRPVTRTTSGGALLDIDWSQLVMFADCPRRYYLRCVCGFAPRMAPEIGFGRAIHQALVEIARRSSGGREPSPDDVELILSDTFYLPLAGPIPFVKLYRAARSRLLRYARRYGAELCRTLALERRFEVPLAGARLRGRIDLILRAERGGPGDVELLDFKTTENRPPTERHCDQLRLYAHAARALGMNPVRLVIHDLDAETGERILVTESPSENAAFHARLSRWLDAMRAGEFGAAHDAAVCSGCDLASLCGRGPKRFAGTGGSPHTRARGDE